MNLVGQDVSGLSPLVYVRRKSPKMFPEAILPSLVMNYVPEASVATVPIFSWVCGHGPVSYSQKSLLSGECSSLMIESMKSNGFFMLDLEGTPFGLSETHRSRFGNSTRIPDVIHCQGVFSKTCRS